MGLPGRLNRRQRVGIAGVQIVDGEARFRKRRATSGQRAGDCMTRGDPVRNTREERGAASARSRVRLPRGRHCVKKARGRHARVLSAQRQYGSSDRGPAIPRDHLDLLIVLFAEGRDIGVALDEKLRHDGRDAGEKMRPERIFSVRRSPGLS